MLYSFHLLIINELKHFAKTLYQKLPDNGVLCRPSLLSKRASYNNNALLK